MKDTDRVRWTIEELRAAVAAALADGYDGPPNGRVRDVPDQRTIRYYTTLGLIDRAAEMRGRTALYCTRHLVQLVAIKKLQAQGLSLAEVQQALVGRPTAELARLAGLGIGLAKEKRDQRPSRTRSFWKEAPAPSGKPEVDETARSGTSFKKLRGAGGRNAGGAGPETLPDTVLCAENGERPQQLQGIKLAANVTLLVDSSRMLEDSELAALRLASSRLIDLLSKLEIIPPREEGDPR
jgi:DNA-binding transcriptional MerR regulator